MQEELNQFERNQVWELVDKPNDHLVIGTKWVFRNKLDEHGIVIRNKARLVAKGYNEEKGYKAYHPSTKRFFVSMDVTFHEHEMFFP